jgi:hypothetical protein
MNTLEDLRRIFDEDASVAPDPFGVVAAAERGATRIRRRRRVGVATGVAVLVTVVAVAVPVVTQRHRADGPTPANVQIERGPHQVTLGVDGSSGYAVTSQDTYVNLQRIGFRNATESKSYRATAIAYDPSAGFDPTLLRRGERIKVSGHEAWYVGNYPFGGYMMQARRTPLVIPAVGWQDPTGTWVLVYEIPNFLYRGDPEDPDRARLLQDAQAVRIEAMHEMTAPISLGPLPAGIPPMSTASSDRRTMATVLLGGQPSPLDAAWAWGPTQGTAVMIEARPDGPNAKVPDKATRVASVAGYPAWFTKATSGTALGNGSLWVRARGCTITFSAWDRDLASAKQLREIASAASYPDCADPATWGPVVRG